MQQGANGWWGAFVCFRVMYEVGGRDLRASGQYPVGLGLKASNLISSLVHFCRWGSCWQRSCACLGGRDFVWVTEEGEHFDNIA